ncbi:MAG TPA: carboxypeptidase-like regulatory domain-containing protein, partial [Pyrinomonadaceae bacterium]
MTSDWRRFVFTTSGLLGNVRAGSRLVHLLTAVNLLLLACGIAAAQVTTSGAVGGTIRDNNQAVISDASVTITNKANGSARTVATNESGEYRIDFLPAGVYGLKVHASGFGDVAADNVEVLVGKTSTFDVTMNPGVQTANVTVTAGEAELVSREKTDISLNITPRDVQDLPLNGRDLGNLAYLAPGAKPVDSYDPTKRRISVFGINGSSGRNVNVTVNGIDNKDNTVGGPVMQFPLEAIQEFVIST